MNEFNTEEPMLEGGEFVKTQEKPQKSRISAFYETIEIIAIALIVVIMINLFAGRMMTVSGDSMYPTLYNTEKIWVSSLGYTPKNGDIVVVQERNAALNDPIVKRVIATENQTVSFDFENWKVYVDGKELSEDYINYEDWCAMKSYGCPEELTVPPGCIFVMGENRNQSTDSRDARVSFIAEDDVLGKVVLRIFPLNKFGAVDD